MRTLALLLLSGSLAFGQAFTFGDVAFLAGLTQATPPPTGVFPPTNSPSGSNVVTVAGKAAWFKAESNVVDYVTSTSLTGTNPEYWNPAAVNTGFNFNDGSQVSSMAMTGTNEFTVECWVYLVQVQGQNYTNSAQDGFLICSGYDTANSETRWWFGASGGYGLPGQVDLRGPGTGAVAVSALTTNTWYHIAGVNTDTDCKIYINGVEAGSSVDVIPDGATVTDLLIGSYQPAYDMPPKGIVDELTIYNRALSASEIAAIYVAGSYGKN